MRTTIQQLAQTRGRILGVDFGDVRTGLAVSDPARFLASGLQTVTPGSMTKTAICVAETAKEQGAVAIVVGLPVNMNGTEGPRAEHIRLFVDMLEEKTELPILLLDERMTTMAASRFLNETNTRGAKRKQVIDTLSAQIILQNALDRLKNQAN